MLGSIHLGSVLGIQVRVHWLFVVLVGVALWIASFSGGLTPGQALAMISLLFGLVFLHELGHCLMARRFGVQVLDITFWPLGGMARMSEIPEDSKVEGLIAIAGPAVNLALAFLAAPVFFYAGVAMESGTATPMVASLGEFAYNFVLLNLGLGIFNLVPAFPMDGGRLLRSWLARRGDWVKATESAVRVGRYFAIVMMGAGLVLSLRGATMLPLVGMFVWISGARELAVVRARHAQYTNPLAAFGFGPRASANEPATAYAEGNHETRPGPKTEVASTDPSGARRPLTPIEARPERNGPGGRGPISADELERLESYPGSIWRVEPE